MDTKLQIPAPTPPKKLDKIAEKENKALQQGRDLEAERAEHDHDRNEITKSCLAWVIRVLIIVAGIALISGLFIWAWHLLMPSCWRWLNTSEIGEIQKLVTSALLGMVASEYARRLFG
ncbi:hypothetical protein [Aurantivibrio plasticivorans]